MGLSSRRRRWSYAAAAAFVLALGVQPAAHASAPRQAASASSSNWRAYLYGPGHSSYNPAATEITAGNVGSLKHDWTWVPPAPTSSGQPSGLEASPTVVNGVVYIGANTGWFYALKAATGAVLWKRFLGYVTGTTCGPLGIVATATVAPAPGGGPLTVYVAGGNGYLYALSAATGTVDWKSVIGIPSTTVNDYFDWSSPTVAKGNIYVGVSSNCDNPLVKGGLKEYSQATGALLHFYQTYPGHSIEPSIWSSAAVDTAAGNVFVTTGNGPGGDSVSMVRLNASTLARQDAWQVPSSAHGSDSDFGGSPTLFKATLGGVSTPMVGACNKNGTYYALKRANLAAGPVWSDAIGAQYTSGPQCDAAAIWGGSHLYIAGNHTTIGGVSYPGSIQRVNPATGAAVWKLGLAGPPIGSPTMDGSGVIAVTQYGYGTTAKGYAVDFVSAATGKLLKSITIGPDFGQPVFADGKVFVPSQNHGLLVYSPPASTQPIAFVAAAGTTSNQPSESVKVPSSVSAGDALVLIATGASASSVTAPAGWTKIGAESSNGVMYTAVWSRVAKASDPGSTVKLTFGTTYRKGAVQLLAYSGTAATSPVTAFAAHADHVTTSTATTPKISVSQAGAWVVSGWAAKSSTVTAWSATPAGQVVRSVVLGSGGGRIDLLATDAAGPAGIGTAGGLKASANQPFSADTTWTLVLAPGP